MKTQPFKLCQIRTMLRAVVAMAIVVPLGTYAGNGTATYFDVNGTAAGFGSPSGIYYVGTGLNYWTTDSSGQTGQTTLAGGRQLTFGALDSDFNGSVFTVGLTNTSSLAYAGVVINSTNANVTFTGAQNFYVNYTTPETISVAGGSTFTDAILFNSFGWNFNNQPITLNGAGTINFNSCVGYNDNNQITQNMPGGTVNLDFNWNAGTASQATYYLQSGTLNLKVPNALNGLHSGKYFTLNGGTLDNTSGSAMTLGVGAGTPVINGSFTFNGSSSLTIPTEYFAAGNWTITVNSNTLAFGGPVTSAAGGGFTLAGAGTLALTGANTYSGATVLSGGTLDLKHQNAAQNSVVTPEGGNLILDSSVAANAFTFGGLAASSSGPGYDLGLTNSAGAAIALTVAGNSAATTYAGVLSGAGSLAVAGSNVLTLAAANTFTGNTTLSGGALDLQNPNALQNSTLTLSGGTSTLIFDSSVSANAFNLGGLAASASGPGYDLPLTNNAGTAIALTLGNDNASSTYAGALSDGGLAGSLTKTGTGTLSLAGTNTYSGATTIANGVLAGVVGGSCSNSIVTVAATAGNTAALGVSITGNTQQWTCPGVIINNTGISSGLEFSFGATVIPSTTVAPLNITGEVTFLTAPVVSIVAANLPVTTGNGYPLMTWGSGSAPSLAGVTLTLPSRIAGGLSIVGNTLYLKITGSTEPLGWTGGSGLWNINMAANLIWKDVTGITTYYQQGASGDSVVFDNTFGSGGAVTLNTNVLPVNVSVNNPAADYIIMGSGSIGGSTTFNKDGARVLTLATTNTYSGGTWLSAGQLNINNGGSSTANSAIGVGPLNIVGTSTIDNTGPADVTLLPVIAENWNADLTYAGSAHSLNLGSGEIKLGGNRQVTVAGNTLTVPGVVTDSGQAYSLTKAGAGTLTLLNANTYSGATTISGGIVNASVAGSLGTSGITTNNGTLNLMAGAVSYTGVNNVLSGTGTVNMTLGTGTATTFLNGDNSSFNGTLNVGINAAVGAGKLQLNGILGSGATVNVLTNGTVYVSGVNQPATITLYGGATGESLGQLRLDAGAEWSGPVTLAGNQTGNFQGIIGDNSGVATISGVISQSGGNWLLSKSGGGNVVLSGTNTYAGGLLVEQGALTILNDQSHASGGLAVGTDNYNACTLNLGDSSQVLPTLVLVGAGNTVQVGAVQSGNASYEVLNAAGADGNPTLATNYGNLYLGRNCAMNIGNAASWFQFGPVNLQPYGGYSPSLNVNNGGSFIYMGTNAIQFTENPGTTGPGTISIGSASTSGGTFITGQPFDYFTNSGAASGVGRITMAGGGTLMLATNIPLLTIGDRSGQFLLGTGDGVIDVSNYNTTLRIGITDISGQSGGLIKAGVGTLTLSGTNSYTGATTINAGTLDVANPLSLEGSTLTMNGGQVVFDSVAGNAFSVGGLAADTSGPGYDLALTNSAGSPITLTVGTNINSGSYFGGVLSGSGSLIQAGSGTLQLYGANTFTGNTIVATGTLELNLACIATNSTVSISNGALLQLDFSGTNLVGGLVLGGTNQAPGLYSSTSTPTYITGSGSLLVVPTMGTNPTNITVTVNGGNLVLSWPADHTGWILQSQTNSLAAGLGTNWVDVASSALANGITNSIAPGSPAVFYRLRLP